jgi:hypothetical protein
MIVRCWAGYAAFCLSAAPAIAGPEVLFEDVTAASGVDYLHWDYARCTACVGSQWMFGGAAPGDFDNDGWTDIYATRLEAPNLLFRNLGDGTFEEVGGAAGVNVSSLSSGCAWGDVNNDGYLDLFVLTTKGRCHLYVNNQDGTFHDQAATWGVSLINFGPQNWTSAAFGDYDLDGDLDLHVTGWIEQGFLNRLFRNTGRSAFEDVTSTAGVSDQPFWGFASGFADLDGDGWPELLVAADFRTSHLFRNLRNGRFLDISEEASIGDDENGMGSAIGDVDNDGDLDWFVTSIYDPDIICGPTGCSIGWGGSGNQFYRNDSTGHFVNATDELGVRNGFWGWGTTFFDHDNDGDVDLGMTNGINFPWTPNEDKFQNRPLRLWKNEGPAAAMPEIASACGLTNHDDGKGYFVLDYDRDGDMDLFVVNTAAHPVLYRCETANQNSWLQVELRGTTTNYFGIGAVVRIQADPNAATQMRLMSINSNYMSHDEILAHFGLGFGVVSVDVVRVEWPASGLVQTVHNVPANQRITMVEPRFGDFDDDRDTDGLDWAVFSSCLSGPQGDGFGDRCARSTTLQDSARFQAAYTGELE